MTTTCAVRRATTICMVCLVLLMMLRLMVGSSGGSSLESILSLSNNNDDSTAAAASSSSSSSTAQQQQQQQQPVHHQLLHQQQQEARLSQQLTVIVLGMARICNPSIGLFRKIWETHEQHFEGFASMRRIVVLDGFGDARLNEKRGTAEASLNRSAYEEFKHRLVGSYLAEKNHTAADDNGANTIVVLELQHHGGLLGSIRAALAMVDTPLIYVTQDDLGLTHHVPTVGVVETIMAAAMDDRNPVRFVLLNKRQNGWATRLDDFYGKWETGNSTITNAVVLSGTPNKVMPLDPETIRVPLMRTKRWSDNNHFAIKRDYLDLYLQNIKTGRKWVDSSHQGLLAGHPEEWSRYGAHMLGEIHEEAYIYHYSGRDPKWCNESLLIEN